MASADVPDIDHIYDPVSDETITDKDGLVEIIITNRTVWVAMCNSNIQITNDAFNSIIDRDPNVIRKECPDCKSEAMRIDPEGFLFDF